MEVTPLLLPIVAVVVVVVGMMALLPRLRAGQQGKTSERAKSDRRERTHQYNFGYAIGVAKRTRQYNFSCAGGS